jgi:hypothetical protein
MTDCSASIIYPNEYLFTMINGKTQHRMLKTDLEITKFVYKSYKIANKNELNTLPNEIYHGTQIFQAIDILIKGGVNKKEVLELTKKYVILWAWSSFYASSKESLHRDFGVMPVAIVYPRSRKEVQYWVKWIKNHNFTISIRSGNCCFEDFSTSNQFIVDTSL